MVILLQRKSRLPMPVLKAPELQDNDYSPEEDHSSILNYQYHEDEEDVYNEADGEKDLTHTEHNSVVGEEIQQQIKPR
jgi:hypothetical protein